MLGGLGLGRPAVLGAATAVLSNVVSNVPAVLVLKPFLAGAADLQRSWLIVAMASTLAGNLTVLGSVANLIVVQDCARPWRHDRLLAIFPGRRALDVVDDPHWAVVALTAMTNEPHLNPMGQPVGVPVEGWSPRPLPPRTPMAGRFATVEPLDPDRHAAELFEANSEDLEGRNFTYYNYGPFADLPSYRRWVEGACNDPQRLFHAIRDNATGCAVGVAAYANVQPAFGVIEVGALNFSPRLQRHAAATDAMHLMMRRVFDELGYRRYEWKCDSLNLPSRAAAARLGFRYEGLFRQAMITRGRNRDTAWFSVVDSEWPALRAAFEAWLDPANFAPDGRQRRSLASFRPDPP